MNDSGLPDLGELLGKPCWHVNIGGATLPTFSLSLGPEVLRDRPLLNPQQPERYRTHRGSFQVTVLTQAWRLQSRGRILLSSAEDDERLATLRERLVNRRVTAVRARRPLWDLTLTFTGALRLTLFSLGTSSTAFEGANWEIETPTKRVVAGPGASLGVELVR